MGLEIIVATMIAALPVLLCEMVRHLVDTAVLRTP